MFCGNKGSQAALSGQSWCNLFFDSSIEIVNCAYGLIGDKEEEDYNLDINLSPSREEFVEQPCTLAPTEDAIWT